MTLVKWWRRFWMCLHNGTTLDFSWNWGLGHSTGSGHTSLTLKTSSCMDVLVLGWLSDEPLSRRETENYEVHRIELLWSAAASSTVPSLHLHCCCASISRTLLVCTWSGLNFHSSCQLCKNQATMQPRLTWIMSSVQACGWPPQGSFWVTA